MSSGRIFRLNRKLSRPAGRPGSCRYGDACHFRHSTEATDRVSLTEWQARSIKTIALPDGVSGGMVCGRKGWCVETIRRDNPDVTIHVDGSSREVRLADSGAGPAALAHAALSVQAVVDEGLRRKPGGMRQARAARGELTAQKRLPVACMLMRKDPLDFWLPPEIWPAGCSNAGEAMLSFLRGDEELPAAVQRYVDATCRAMEQALRLKRTPGAEPAPPAVDIPFAGVLVDELDIRAHSGGNIIVAWDAHGDFICAA